jgi:hypothetical protein
MEIWWTGWDGSVWDAYWFEGFPAWKSFPLEPRGWASTWNSGIAAVSPDPDSMVVWYVGSDGSVQEENFYNGGWSNYRIAGAGSASIQSKIAAVSRKQPGHDSNTMEIWWVGADGSVQDAYWYDAGIDHRFERNWNQRTLAGGAVNSGISSRIAAVSRRPDTMGIWWIGMGSGLLAPLVIKHMYWYGPFSTAIPSQCEARFYTPPPCIYDITFDSLDGRHAGAHWEGEFPVTDANTGYMTDVGYSQYNMLYGREGGNWQPQFNFGGEVHDVAINNLQPGIPYGVIVQGKVFDYEWSSWSEHIVFETWQR